MKRWEIIARGYNRRNADKTVLSHAEVTSIKEPAKKKETGAWKTVTLYVTLEPCPMCAGAIVQARIPRVVIGSMNSKAGCAGSVLNLLKEPGFNHQAQVVTGIIEEECSEMMSSFFTQLRKKKRLPETP
ncbi:MAG: nucleoside deaminase [Enterocloster sp.]